MSVQVVYYEGFTGRATPLIRMLCEGGVAYEHKMDESVFSCKGAEGTTFAPPAVIDGGKKISQSIAATVHIGAKCGLDKGVDPVLALQYMLDAEDFGTQLGNAKNAGMPALKTFLTEGRFASWAGNIERSIKGPYYFGEKASYADFALAGKLESADFSTLGPLQAKTGDLFAKYPKIAGVKAGIMGLESAKKIDVPCLPDKFKLADDLVAAY